MNWIARWVYAVWKMSQLSAKLTQFLPGQIRSDLFVPLAAPELSPSELRWPDASHGLPVTSAGILLC